MLNDFVSGIIAGILISLGGAAMLSCDNRIAGAVLFCLPLLCICLLGYYLFTGKVCFMIKKHDAAAWQLLLLCLLGNFAGTLFCGLLLASALPALQETARASVALKLTQLPMQTFVRACFCGSLIYLAVAVFAQNKNVTGIFFCIPAFVLSGFEHSIADMFYFSLASSFNLKSALFILIVIAGNSVGGLFIPFLRLGLTDE